MSLRTANIWPFAFERGSRGNYRKALFILLVLGALILYVGGKVSIVRLGYQLEALEREKKELERTNAELRIEASSLASSARLEELAVKKLGMMRPPKENIVVVKRKGAPGQ